MTRHCQGEAASGRWWLLSLRREFLTSDNWKKRLLTTSLLVGFAGTVWTGAAIAQEAPAEDDTVVEVPEVEEDEESAMDTVFVTGSRLPSTFTSTAPMSVITADSAQLKGIADVSSLLQTSTVAAGSAQVTAVTSSAFVENGGVGTETISLRGLGANRTLTLLNGRRAGPAGTRGAVSSFDLNVIPLSAIERVEILKDGASSVYGSDAVAGVVNIITKKNDGGDANFFYSGPLDGGGEELRADASYGKDLGRFSFRVTGDYYKREELARGDRDFFDCQELLAFDTATGERADLIDPRTGDYVCRGDLIWGHIWTYDYNNTTTYAPDRPWNGRPALLQYDYSGTLGNFIPEFGPVGGNLTVGDGFYGVAYGEILTDNRTDPFYDPFARASEAVTNYNHPFQSLQSLSPEVERMTAYGSGEFEVTDSMTAYSEFLLNRRVTRVNGYRQYWNYQYVYNYGGTLYGDPMAISQGFTGDNVGFSPTAITDHNSSEITVDYMRFVAGLEGDLAVAGRNWAWDVSAQFSRSDGEYQEDIIFDDAISPYNFQTSLCEGTVTPVRGVPCVDVNWYSPDLLAGNPTAEERAFLFGTDTGNTIYEQWSIDGFLGGDLIELPAGMMSVGFGFQYREDKIEDTPGEAVLAGNAWGQSTAGITAGDDATSAVFGEVAIPLLAELPGVYDLSFNASARYTDVESYGSDSTYKIGLNWSITDEIRLRATNGTSFRTPALYELYLANQTSFASQRSIDPCIGWGSALASGDISQQLANNCSADGVPANHGGSGASAEVASAGGFGLLEAETSESSTFGLVYTPKFADFQLAIDYFEIEVNDQVDQLGASTILFGCYSSLNFGTDPLCDLFTRNGANDAAAYLISTVQNDFINISTQENRGIDFRATYAQDLFGGRLGLATEHTIQLEESRRLLPTSEQIDYNGEGGDPQWVGDFDVSYDKGPWSFFYNVRYVGATSNKDSYAELNGGSTTGSYLGTEIRYILETEEVFYHNASLARSFDNGFTVRAGVSNIFDTEPPIVSGLSGEYSSIGNAVIYSQYDLMGRSAFVNISKSF